MLVCAFRGWNDGGQAATLAATFLRETLGAERFCDLDPEEFYDFQETRPTVRLEDGMIRRIDWPENSVTHAALPGLERDVAILLGIEPQLRWRTFSQTVLELVRALKIEFVITLGGLLADTPHTRPVPVTGTADGEVATKLGLSRSSYEGPDRDRRRAARRVPRGGRSVREPVGGSPPLHLGVAEPEGRACPDRPPRSAARDALPDDGARPGRGALRAPGHLRRRLGRGREHLRA